MEIGFIILIIILSIILVGIGSYIVMQKDGDDESSIASLHTSGVFSLIRKSPREDLEKVKPSPKEIVQFLENQELPAEEIETIAQMWQNSLNLSIQTIEEGDQNGIQTYKFEMTDKDLSICTFLNRSSYVTREQVFNNPELLPPYYPGCTCRLISKEAWEDQDKSDWQPLLPQDGQYGIPEWNQLA
ncbi:MAG: hypothetical protein OCC49_08185 [Fibrobacterales bacterium]